MRSRAQSSLNLLGNLIEVARRKRGWTITHAAQVVGLNPRTYRAIEQGKPTVAIGAAFDAAIALGVPLFHEEDQVREALRAATQAQLQLLPARVAPMTELPNDF